MLWRLFLGYRDYLLEVCMKSPFAPVTERELDIAAKIFRHALWSVREAQAKSGVPASVIITSMLTHESEENIRRNMREYLEADR